MLGLVVGVLPPATVAVLVRSAALWMGFPLTCTSSLPVFPASSWAALVAGTSQTTQQYPHSRGLGVASREVQAGYAGAGVVLLQRVVPVDEVAEAVVAPQVVLVVTASSCLNLCRRAHERTKSIQG